MKPRRIFSAACLSLPLASALVALMVVSLVHAAELVVPTQYPSIQAAINASVSGDIVTVRPGAYNERLDIGGRNITLRSLLGPNATIIDPQGVVRAFHTYPGGVLPDPEAVLAELIGLQKG